MATLYSINLRHEVHAHQLWAFSCRTPGRVPAALLTTFEDRAALMDEQRVAQWLETSPAVRNGWRAYVRVATAQQLRRQASEVQP